MFEKYINPKVISVYELNHFTVNDKTTIERSAFCSYGVRRTETQTLTEKIFVRDSQEQRRLKACLER